MLQMKYAIRKCFVVLYILYYVEIIDAENICKVPNAGAGTCIQISECKPIMELYKKKFKTQGDNLFLQQASCGRSGSQRMKVCCPARHLWPKFEAKHIVYPGLSKGPGSESKEPEVTRSPPVNPLAVTPYSPEIEPNVLAPATGVIVSQPAPELNRSKERLKKQLQDKCGEDSSSSDKIIGGQDVAIDEYPWLALLEYADGSLSCGGSVISPEFILTAAHCLNGQRGEPVIVRLSEYDITTGPIDSVPTNGDGLDNITVVLVGVTETYVHPQFSREKKIHDIGLIRMNETINITQDFIKKICLPFENYVPEFTPNTNLTVAGWGSIDNVVYSDVKLQVDVPFVPWESCEKVQDEGVMNTQICAGGVEGKDSCKGDSGGPLMYAVEDIYYVVGIVSYGAPHCGTKGRPATHTNVHYYISWILDVMARTIVHVHCVWQDICTKNCMVFTRFTL